MTEHVDIAPAPRPRGLRRWTTSRGELDPRLVTLLTAIGQTGLVAAALRLAALVGAAVAIAATAAPSWDAPDGYLLVAVIAGVVAPVRPDSAAALATSLAVAVAWATGASGDVTPATVLAALGLLVLHAACALAAAAPLTAAIERAVLAAWWRPLAALAGVTILTAAVTAGLSAWSPPGSIVVTLVALAVLTAVVWSVAQQDR